MFGATVAANVGTQTAAFSYDPPVISAIGAVANLALSQQGNTIAFSGMNFGSSDYSQSVTLGATGCVTVSWTTGTRVQCAPPSGGLAGIKTLYTVIKADVLPGTTPAGPLFFTYDSPVVTVVNSANLASSAGQTISVCGLNFGLVNTSPGLTIGASAVSTVVWISNTAIVASAVLTGTGTGYAVQTAVLTLVHTLSNSFSFDSPVLSFRAPINSPAAPVSQSVTVLGFNFGSSDATSTGAVAGSSVCVTTAWTTDSSVLCSVPAGSILQALALTVSKAVGTLTNAFTFDAPVLTRVDRSNAALTGSIIVTVSGTNFASLDPSLTVSIGNTACSQSLWVSATSLTCGVASSGGSGKALSVTAKLSSTLIGTGIRLFTYDSPVVTYSYGQNGPTSAGPVVSVQGANFGQADLGGTLYIGKTACAQTSYISATQLKCNVAYGQGRADVLFFADGLWGTLTGAFTYDAPVITRVNAVNAPTKWGGVVTVQGTNFGMEPSAASVLVGGTVCFKENWVSGTSLECTVQTGFGLSKLVGVHVGLIAGSLKSVFSYDAPVLTYVSSVNGPTAGGVQLLTFSGINFESASTAVLKLAGTVCPSAAYVSDSSIACTTAAGSANAQTALLTTATGSSQLASYFTHDAPVLTYIAVTNGPTAGSVVVTIQGKNFGTVDLTLTSTIGGSAFGAVTYVSDSSITGTVAAGTGIDKKIVLTLGSRVSGVDVRFSYDPPNVLSVAPANAPNLGLTTVTVSGANFGTSASAGTVTIGGTACLQQTFVTATSVLCVAPPTDRLYTTPRDVAISLGTYSAALGSSLSRNGVANTASPNNLVNGLTLGSASVVLLQVTNASYYDQIRVTGGLNLTGTLKVVFLGDFVPDRTTVWQFITATPAANSNVVINTTSTFTNVTTSFSNSAYTVKDNTGSLWSITITVPGT
jgi:hypothetical protein